MTVQNRSRYWPLLFAALLAIVAASRIPRINGFALDLDEIWNIWQTFGTPQQIIQWTSPNETPFYFLTLGLWKSLVGFDPFAVRALSALSFLVATALLFRAVKRLHNERVALLATLVYSALACNIFLSLYARSYMLTLILWPLAWWLTVRYFDRPRWWRALALGLCLAGMYFSTVTAVPALVLIGLYTVVVYRRQIWRWWLPGIVALVVVLPDTLSKLALVADHTGVTRPSYKDPLIKAVLDFFAFFTGYPYGATVWWLLLIGAVALIVFRRQTGPRAWLWAALVVIIPLALYALEPRLGYYIEKRYAWWYMFPLALLIALGLACLPRRVQLLGATGMVALMFIPFRVNNYSYLTSPLAANLEWLSEQARWDDVIVRDPHIHCDAPEEWDYYLRLYFPNGLHFVTNPTGYSRVWYATSVNEEDPALYARVKDGRLAEQFVGPPACFFRLFQGPPDAQGILFENQMRFHGADVLEDDGRPHTPTVLREGQQIHVRLWWSVDAPTTLDYSVGLYLLEEGKPLIAESNGAPQLIYPDRAPAETSRWLPGQFYIEERVLTLPPRLPTADIPLYMAVYFYKDNKRQSAPGVTTENLLLLDHVFVKAW